jgi:hypothetical protein
MPTVVDDSNKKFGEYGSEEDIEGGSMLEKNIVKLGDKFTLAEDPWADTILSIYRTYSTDGG